MEQITKEIEQIYLYLLLALFLVIPINYWISNLTNDLGIINFKIITSLLSLIFFTLICFQVATLNFQSIFNKYFNTNSFHQVTKKILLTLIIIHPIIFLILNLKHQNFDFPFKLIPKFNIVFFLIVAITLFNSKTIKNNTRQLLNKPESKVNYSMICSFLVIILIQLYYLTVEIQVPYLWFKYLSTFYLLSTILIGINLCFFKQEKSNPSEII